MTKGGREIFAVVANISEAESIIDVKRGVGREFSVDAKKRSGLEFVFGVKEGGGWSSS